MSPDARDRRRIDGRRCALLRGVDVLVATPGRLLDLMQSNGSALGQVEILVLDEADRMLDMGFIHDIRKIVAQAADQAADAVLLGHHAAAIAELAEAMLRDPARVAVTPPPPPAEPHRPAGHPGRGRRQAGLLAEVLRGPSRPRAGVHPHQAWRRQGRCAAWQKAGTAAAIHGNKSQNQRERVLAAFRNGEHPHLVATDIAARGIDVEGISHVVNYDLPNVRRPMSIASAAPRALGADKKWPPWSFW